MNDGHFTISSRVYLRLDERRKLERLLEEQELELPDLLTDLLRAYLERHPAPPPPVTVGRTVHVTALRNARTMLRRLRAHPQAGADAPDWLRGLMNDLEAEIRRLEREEEVG